MEPNSQVENTEVENQSDLDFLLKQYSSPANVAEGESIDEPEKEETKIVTEPVQNFGDSDAPYGRYASGTKKGQPRKAPKSSTAYSQDRPPIPSPESVKLSGTLIEAGVFLTLVNLVIPLLISVLNNQFTKDKIKPDQIKLTKEQIKDLDPICDAVLKQVSLTGNPMVLLFIGLFAAFGLNLLGAKMDSTYKPK